MELITFESKAYQQLVNKIERIADYVAKSDTPSPVEKREIWLDSNEVAELLRISTSVR
jgi:hypothetical protein